MQYVVHAPSYYPKSHPKEAIARIERLKKWSPGVLLGARVRDRARRHFKVESLLVERLMEWNPRGASRQTECHGSGLTPWGTTRERKMSRASNQLKEKEREKSP